MPEVAPIARHVPRRGQRLASPEYPERTACSQEYVRANRGPAWSYRVAQGVYRLILSDATDLPRLHREAKFLISIPLQYVLIDHVSNLWMPSELSPRGYWPGGLEAISIS